MQPQPPQHRADTTTATATNVHASQSVTSSSFNWRLVFEHRDVRLHSDGRVVRCKTDSYVHKAADSSGVVGDFLSSTLRTTTLHPKLYDQVRRLMYMPNADGAAHACSTELRLRNGHPLTLAKLFPHLHSLALTGCCLDEDRVAVDQVFGEESGQQWKLNSLTVTAPYISCEMALHYATIGLSPYPTWLPRLLTQQCSSLRCLEIRLDPFYSRFGYHDVDVDENSDDADRRMTHAAVHAVIDARLEGLQELVLAYWERCQTEELDHDNNDGDNDDESDEFDVNLREMHFGHYSEQSSALCARLFRSLPSLTALTCSYFHPLVVFPHCATLPLTSLNWSGLLTLSSLPHLARLSTLQHLELDFYVEEQEMKREWRGESDIDQQLPRSITDAYEAAGMEASLPSPPPDRPSSSSYASSTASFYLFHALARLTDLRSLQLQSTLEDRNFCLVDFSSFALLQSLTNLERVQFSSFFSQGDEQMLPARVWSQHDEGEGQGEGQGQTMQFSDLSLHLYRLTQQLPSLKDVILNIERVPRDNAMEREDEDGEEEDENDDEDEDESGESALPQRRSSAPQHQTSSAVMQVTQPSVQIPTSLDDATSSSASSLASTSRSCSLPADAASLTHKCQLRKLGVWDGHVLTRAGDALIPGSSTHPLPSDAYCALTQLKPFIEAHPRIEQFSLIFCHLATFQPLQLLSQSLRTLCLYFSHTMHDSASAAVDDWLTAPLDPNIAALSCCTNLSYLILHGTGRPSSCMSRAQLLQLGRLIDDRMPRLRNLRIEHQSEMGLEVWNEWIRPTSHAQRCEHDSSKEGASISLSPSPVRFRSLHSLSFKDCSNFGLNGVTRIVEDLCDSLEAQRNQKSNNHAAAALLSSSSSAPPIGGGESSTPSVLLPSLVDLNLPQPTFSPPSRNANEMREQQQMLVQAKQRFQQVNSCGARYIQIHIPNM